MMERMNKKGKRDISKKTRLMLLRMMIFWRRWRGNKKM